MGTEFKSVSSHLVCAIEEVDQLRAEDSPMSEVVRSVKSPGYEPIGVCRATTGVFNAEVPIPVACF